MPFDETDMNDNYVRFTFRNEIKALMYRHGSSGFVTKEENEILDEEINNILDKYVIEFNANESK